MRRILHALAYAAAPLLIIIFIIPFTTYADDSQVVRENGRVYIVDKTNERWDVTEAEGLGFTPSKFTYGIGRNALTPLDDTGMLKKVSGDEYEGMRVVGINEGRESKAYSVDKLKNHDVINSSIAGMNIAVTYCRPVNLLAVYRSEIDGHPLTLAASGWLYDQTFILYDMESGSLWFPEMDGLISIQGKYYRQRLTELDSDDTYMEDWIEEHPHTWLLK